MVILNDSQLRCGHWKTHLADCKDISHAACSLRTRYSIQWYHFHH